MNLNLDKKTALITGSSKGIGLEIAKRLLGEGCHVRLVARSGPLLEQIRTELQGIRSDREISIHVADLGIPGDIKNLASSFVGVDILVNSAGAVIRGGLLDADPDAFRTSVNAKVMGTIDMCREAYRVMKEKGGGVIINVIGMSGERPNPKSIGTSTANAALIAFTQAVGSKSPDDNIRVVGINPALVATPRTQDLKVEGGSPHDSAYSHVLNTLPFGRMASTAEMADMALFLASERASYCSGSVYALDGGSRFRV